MLYKQNAQCLPKRLICSSRVLDTDDRLLPASEDSLLLFGVSGWLLFDFTVDLLFDRCLGTNWSDASGTTAPTPIAGNTELLDLERCITFFLLNIFFNFSILVSLMRRG